jgi:hypothetical protein|tara:strand:- start:581 stop:781 length:201 start_codon:yes stop_codon:yes gene_type:complete
MKETTLFDMFKEVHSKIPCGSSVVKAKSSNITIRSNKDFFDLVSRWVSGEYDSNPAGMLEELKKFL